MFLRYQRLKHSRDVVLAIAARCGSVEQRFERLKGRGVDIDRLNVRDGNEPGQKISILPIV